MIWTVLLVSSLLHFIKQGETQGLQTCTPQPTCKECLKSPRCVWCKQADFLKLEESNERRCDTEESLKSRNCSNIFYREIHLELLKNRPLSNEPNNVVQLQPQNLKIRLGVGEPLKFRVSFKRAEGYPIDLYYLMDLSYSMKDDLNMIKNLGEDIVNTLRTFTKHIRIGFGSFVDKVALPFVSQVRAKRKNPCPGRLTNCQPAFSFKSILSLTEDASDFKREVSRQSISGNLDSPEAGFDAIMQAATCEDIIGWKNVTRILVYTSDDTFHIAGDGKLAGIFEPHDGKCHLNSTGFYDGTRFDYPSVGHLSRVLSANNIQLIFAVTEDIVSSYKVLSKLIPQSVVGVLKNDSSNVVQLISEAYNNLSSTIFLEHQGTPQDLDVSYQSHCGPDQNNAPWQKRGECMNVKIKQQVDFIVRLNITSCLEKPAEFTLKVKGISESLKITIETVCDCDCKDAEESSRHCNKHGKLSCGVCSCYPGFQGQRCNCEKTGNISSMDVCRKESSSPLCSGHGSCECGMCRCQGSYTGDYCDCDPNSCARYNNKLCGGHGRCECGKCNCFKYYEGESCECEVSTNNCKTEGNSLCSGHGKCICNMCKCSAGFTGANCSVMINACNLFRPCMECIAAADENSCKETCGVDADLLKTREHTGLECSTKQYMYDAKVFPDGRIHVRYADLPRSIDKTMVIIGSSVSGIIFTGLLLIIASRLLLELHYRREYRSFLNAQKQTVWKDDQNPLFKDATTTVVNPLHFQDEF